MVCNLKHELFISGIFHTAVTEIEESKAADKGVLL